MSAPLSARRSTEIVQSDIEGEGIIRLCCLRDIL